MARMVEAPAATGGEFRRIDWRFLLPAPRDGTAFERLLLLGGTAGLAELVRQAGLARTVVTDPADGSAFDAAAVLAPDRPPLEWLRARLLPGAPVYLELDRRRGAGPPTVWRRALERGGFRVSGIWAVLPSLERRGLYMPLDRPEALRWYLEALAITDTRRRRVLASMLRTAVAAAPAALRYWARSYAITATRGPGSPGPPAILGHQGCPGAPVDASTRLLVLTGGDTDDFNRVVLLPIPPREPRPRLVMKLARVPERNVATIVEQRVQRELKATLPPSLRDSIPEPLGTFDWHGLVVGVERCAPGRLVAASTGSGKRTLAQADFDAVTSWIAAFHRATRSDASRWGTEVRTRWLDRPLEAYTRNFGLRPEEARLAERLRALDRELEGARFPLVCLHWGLSGVNIYRAGETISVVDWEGGEPGPPLYDLLYYLIEWVAGTLRPAARPPARPPREHAFREIFLAPATCAQAAVAHGAIRRYLEALELDRRFLRLLLPMLCVERALGRYERGARQAPPEAARTGNEFTRWLELLAAYTCRTGLLAPAATGLLTQPPATDARRPAPRHPDAH